MSEDMVERVARAISKARALPGTKPARTSDVDRRAARAAIEAMREPTEEMARYGSYEAENCIKEDPCGNAGKHVWKTDDNFVCCSARGKIRHEEGIADQRHKENTISVWRGVDMPYMAN